MTEEALEGLPMHNYDPNQRGPTPPPYSGPSNITQEPAPRPQLRGPQKYPGLPQLDYRLYSPPLFELSSDCTTIRTTAPYLSTNATALVSLIRAQSTVPPKPQIHIVGKRGNHKVDFAIKLNLMSLLVPEDPRQRMDYVRCVGDDELAMRGGYKPSTEPVFGDGGVEEWVRRFIEDSGPVKTFTLERVVANLDTNWIEGQVRSMIASTAYKGVVSVTFPVTHSKVVVQNPDKVNKFFTSVTSLFSGKRKYEVVKAVWPFATHKSGEPGRRCVVQSEETWWREWRDPIKYAIATKRQGWVTNEDKLEAIMEGVGKGVSVVDWGPEY
ncbi:poly(A) polymerase [Diplogelasinospora grovesii]|uniref:Poly(A) polymerase n=1 Tax=Diplogelasinospora grovesii TaxID=303347 RepID=A0AAN6S4B8_9PEZI|nr:poly(A) polymerase [Diplogelasinospora grovesii]